MECPTPITRRLHLEGVEFPITHGCGNCTACGINRRSEWAGRIMLESCLHQESQFVTLTYDEYNIPDDRSVSKEEAQKWLKRLRKRLPYPVRYFLCAEYGDKTLRPHYHAVIFGLHWDDVPAVQESWSQGFTLTAPLLRQHANYVARYTVKKMGNTQPYVDQESGVSLAPEFALMSRRPGLGAGAVPTLAHHKDFWLHLGAKQLTRPANPSSGRALPPFFLLDGKRYRWSRFIMDKLSGELDAPQGDQLVDRKRKRRYVVESYRDSLSIKTTGGRAKLRRKRDRSRSLERSLLDDLSRGTL